MILDEEILSHWFRQQGETNKLYLTSAEKNMLSQVQKKIQYSIVHIALTMMKNYGTTKSYFYIFLLLICEVFLKKHDYIVLKIFHFLKKHFLVFKKLFSIFFLILETINDKIMRLVHPSLHLVLVVSLSAHSWSALPGIAS